MQVIISPINPKDTGTDVSNLQTALQLFLDNQIIATFQQPDNPTLEEIFELSELLKKEIGAAEFDDATRRLVLFFQLQQGLSDQFNGAVEEKTAAKMNEILKALGVLDDADGKFIVKGFIYYSTGEGYPNITVNAFDCDLRRTEPLGKTTTDEKGYYEIEYGTETFANNEKGKADIKIIAQDSKNQLSKESEIYFNATQVQEVNLSMPALPTIKGKSEWEILDEQVLPLLKGQKKNLAAFNVFEDLLPEELKQDDFDFIAQETGLDKNNIELWSLAYSRSKELSSIAPEIFYGWFKMGLPTELKDLLARTTDELEQKLKEAINENIIPVISRGMEKIIAAINKARQQFHLQPAKDGEKPSLGDVLNTAGNDWLDDEKKKKYVDIAKELDPDADEDFNKKIDAIGFTADEKKTLQKTLRLNKLTLSHPPLMEALQTYVESDTDASLKPLATIHTDQWIDLAYTHGVPAGSTLATEDYAIQLSAGVEDRLPTASLVNKINSGEILFNQAGIERVKEILNSPIDFDIVKDDIATVATTHKLNDESKSLLKSLQNLKKLGTRWEDTDAFINQRITSVQEIVEYSPAQLKAIFKDDVEPEKIATVQSNAIAAQNIGIGLLGYLQPALYGVKAYVMESSNGQEQGRSTGSSAQPLMAASGTAGELDPTLRTLFAALEQCACDPCLSVVSPAAYYADLLNYIDHSGNAGKVLENIRPDLYDLELSCDNAQIELPYIDLALEILENKVAFPFNVPVEPGALFEEQPDKTKKMGDSLIKAIQKTADETLVPENLVAEKGNDSNWIINDHYRRWLIWSQEESLATMQNSNNLKDSIHINKFMPLTEFFKWLNSKNANNTNIRDQQARLALEDELFKKAPFRKVPKDFTSFSYSVLKLENFHWAIEYEIKYNIVIKQNSGDPSISDVVVVNEKKETEIIKTINSKTAADTESKLTAGIVPLLLKTEAKSKKLTVQPDNNGAGFIISYGYTTTLYYNPAQVVVKWLTYQSTKANTNLFAQPQNRNPLAYKVLGTDAVYPWSLPYSQPLAETRLLLEKAGTSRLNLLDAVATDENKFSTAQWAREVLGISEKQQEAITISKEGVNLWKAWGFIVNLIDPSNFPDGEPIHQYEISVYDSFENKKIIAEDNSWWLFKKTSVVMQQAGIDFTELQGLLLSRFINNDNISIINKQNCDLSEMILSTGNSDSNFDYDNLVLDAFCDRLHRFIRLRRALGWSITQLDQAIMSPKIGAGKLDDPCILCIAQIKRLQQQSGIPLDTLIAFFSPFSNDKTIAYTQSGKQIETAFSYDRIFQNRLVQNPVNKDLAFGSFKEDAEHKLTHGKTWNELMSSVAASLSIRQSELQTFLQSGLSDFANIHLTQSHPTVPEELMKLDDLHAVWTNLSLATVLTLSLEDYVAACKLVCPFTTLNPPAVSPLDSPKSLLHFIYEIKFINKTGIKANDLEKILSGRNEEDILPVETAARILTGLQKELRTITNLNLGKFKLEKRQLTQLPFIIPDTESDRWRYWGLTEVAGSANWTVADPIDATTHITGLPLSLLQQEVVLIQQINFLIPAEHLGSEDLINILQTSYVSPNGRDELKIVVTPGTIASIPELTTVHLDRLARFVYLKRVTELSPGDLDNLIKNVASSGHEPLKYDLNLLIDAAQTFGLKQHDVIVNYFANIYNQDIKSIDSVLSRSIKVNIRPPDRISPGLFIYSALQILTSFDFWNENIKIRKNKVIGSDEYGFTLQVWKEGILMKEIKLEDFDAYIIVIKLQKLFILNQYWKATPSQLNWLSKSYSVNDTTFRGVVPDQLSSKAEKIQYLHWKRSTLLFQTAQTSAEFENLFTNYLAALTNTESATEVADSRNVLATAFGVKPEDVNAGTILQEMNTNAAGNFDPIKLCRLIDYLSQLQKLGLNAKQYDKLIEEPINIPFESVRIARQVLFARFSGGNYADALKEVNNKLRMEARDMLVDYLKWKERVLDANGLYEKYLIDVEMSACMRTTRLLQSIAAAQLFVHRCLLNLQNNPSEPQFQVSPSWFDKKRWEWTKNYRVWEANRKVFLYPENWLYPELRDDKTATFKTFETALTQNEASDKNAKDALINYTEELVELSKITVMGMHTYQDIDGVVKIFQVGRTVNPPYSFYWREFWLFNSWTGWAKIDQDLSADHIIPFTHGQDLCIAWPNINTKNENAMESYEVGLSWIRKTNKGWTERRKSIDKIKIDGLINRDERSMFLFRVNENVIALNDVKIQLFAALKVPKGIKKPETPTYEVGFSHATDQPTNLRVNIFRYIYFEDTGRNELQDQSYGVIFFNKLKLDGSNYIPGNEQEWTPAFPPSTINLNVQVGVIAHTFGLVWQSDESPNHTSKEVQITIGNNYHYTVNWNIVFLSKNDPKPQVETIDSRKELTFKGEFNLFSDKDGEWLDANSRPPVQPPINSVLTPPPNTYFFSSGLKESTFNKQSLDAQINLFDNAGIDITLTQKSKPNEKYFAIRSSNLTPLGFHAWHIEEGNNKMLVVEPDAASSAQTRPVMVTVTGYSEAKNIKSNASNDMAELVKIQLSDSFLNESFGLKGLEDYKEGNNAMPISAYTGFTPFPFPFQPAMPYALYNWEIFYHLPIAAAAFLSKQHRFEEARKWFHYVFDPTTNDPNTNKDRFWRFLPFKSNNQESSISELLNELSKPGSGTTNIQGQIDAWLADPFNPFAVARMRTNAYEWFTVTAYIKNLIEWGDQLFRRDTRESINEATLLYVMASDILGRRPLPIPSNTKSVEPLSYRALKKRKIDKFSNTWVTLLDTPYGKQLLEKKVQGFAAKLDQFIELAQLSSVGSPYFCVPPNEKLPELWDTVADRLFKIRNCKNFEGVTRNLPLLDPPIDPEILIRAKLKGVSVSDALNDMYAPPPLYRFSIVLQKATDLCNEVKALGGAMLSAIEKKEAEHLSLLRSGQEIEMQKLVAAVRQAQINEAAANIDALRKSKENIIARVMYLQRQMGSAETTLDADGVPVLHESYVTQPLANLDITVADFAGLGLIQSESDQVVFMQTNNIFNLIGGGLHTASGLAYTAAASYAAVPSPADGPAKTADKIGKAFSALGTFANTMASHYAMLEKRSGQMAGWQRRRDEWLYQAKTAVLEIKQIDKQIIASEIRKAMAEKELDNHYKQIEHTKTLDDYLRKQKFSSETLYTWMESRLSIVYKSAFDMAYEQAKKAEKAFRFELGDELTNFITPGYWDTMQKGLLAGEGLMQDLKRMEIAYLDRNKRDFEITKHISLRQLDPFALLQLKAGNTCNFDIHEVLFDMDFPGHYFRRIKSVSISIPCIAGPYTSVSATLSLTSNKLRRNAADEELSNGYSSNQSSIATSHGQNDSGMFELNFRDERYMPFEGCGAESSWSLELPKLKQFDYDTISDVVVHLKYTARFDSGLKQRASDLIMGQLNALAQQFGENGLHVPISLKHDMPKEWNLLAKNLPVPITIATQRLPYMAQGNVKIDNITFFVRLKSDLTISNIDIIPTGISATAPTSVPVPSTPATPITTSCPLEQYGDSSYYKGTKNNFDGKSPSINANLPFHFDLSGIDQSILNELDDLVMVIKYVLLH